MPSDGDARWTLDNVLDESLAAPLAESILEASPDCVKLISLDGSLSYLSENGQRAMEIADFAALRGRQWAELWPEAGRERIARSVEAATRGERTSFEAFCPTAKGSPRWWHVSVSPVVGDSGRPERILSISRDITERVEREGRLKQQEAELRNFAKQQALTIDEKTLLLQEVDHRVKNSLAVITSLLSMQSRAVESEEARDALHRASTRVHTIATVHEALYHHGSDGELDLAAYLRSLVTNVSTMIGESNIEIRSDIADLGRISGDTALTIGLLVTELVTNGVRHSSPDGDDCSIEVKGRLSPDGKRELSISDNGCGLPDDFDPRLSKGLGMRVVLSGVNRLKGEMEFDSPKDCGTRFTVRF